jgi:hypothetical protein
VYARAASPLGVEWTLLDAPHRPQAEDARGYWSSSAHDNRYRCAPRCHPARSLATSPRHRAHTRPHRARMHCAAATTQAGDAGWGAFGRRQW